MVSIRGRRDQVCRCVLLLLFLSPRLFPLAVASSLMVSADWFSVSPSLLLSVSLCLPWADDVCDGGWIPRHRGNHLLVLESAGVGGGVDRRRAFQDPRAAAGDVAVRPDAACYAGLLLRVQEGAASSGELVGWLVG